MTFLPAIHIPTTYWFYDDINRPGRGVVVYGERDWCSYALSMFG